MTEKVKAAESSPCIVIKTRCRPGCAKCGNSRKMWLLPGEMNVMLRVYLRLAGNVKESSKRPDGFPGPVSSRAAVDACREGPDDFIWQMEVQIRYFFVDETFQILRDFYVQSQLFVSRIPYKGRRCQPNRMTDQRQKKEIKHPVCPRQKFKKYVMAFSSNCAILYVMLLYYEIIKGEIDESDE